MSLRKIENPIHDLSHQIYTNYYKSFFYKIANIALQIILVPCIVSFLTPLKYGVWVTVFSVINWLSLLDFGIGTGLRYKLAEAQAKGDRDKAKAYILNAYLSLALISITFYGLTLLIVKFVNWSLLLNVNFLDHNELECYIIIMLTFFFINFVLRLISNILYANQESSKIDLIMVYSNLIFLAFLSIIKYNNTGSLSLAAIGYGFSTLVPFLLWSLSYYREHSPWLKIKKKDLKVIKIKDLSVTSLYYYIMQISAMIIFSTDYVIISHLFSPSEVSRYDICYKYFAIVQSIFILYLNPLWSAYTIAFTRGEHLWIQSKIKHSIFVWIIILLLLITMIFFSKIVIKLWIGDEIIISTTLSISMALFICISMWNNIFGFFLNGIGKIRLLSIQSVFIGIINIPLSIILALKFNLGIEGVVLGSTVSLLISSIFAPLQTFRILHSKAYGIWAR